MPSIPEADRATPITRDDLPGLDGREVALRNADLALLGRAVFSVGGAPVGFQRVPGAVSVSPSGQPAVWFRLTWSGLPLLVAASTALADAVAQSLADVGVDQLGASGLELLSQLMLAPLLPAGLTLREAACSREALTEMPEVTEPLGTWQGRHLDSGEPSGHWLALWAEPRFPLAALLGAVAGLASSHRPHALAALPIALPLVAARWSVDADQLLDLAVGDVLILG